MLKNNNKWLLMITPDLKGKPTVEPVMDDITIKMDYILSRAEKHPPQGGSMHDWSGHCWKGWHETRCGKRSVSNDWRIPTFPDTWTNSLADYYVKYYRSFVPKEELDKIEKIYKELRYYEDNPKLYKKLVYDNYCSGGDEED